MAVSLLAVAQQIGDKVELVEGYERFGDASSGPLQVGDRGVVVELQRGPNGERWVAACKRGGCTLRRIAQACRILPIMLFPFQALCSCAFRWPSMVVPVASDFVGEIPSHRLSGRMVSLRLASVARL